MSRLFDPRFAPLIVMTALAPIIVSLILCLLLPEPVRFLAADASPASPGNRGWLVAIGFSSFLLWSMVGLYCRWISQSWMSGDQAVLYAIPFSLLPLMALLAIAALNRGLILSAAFAVGTILSALLPWFLWLVATSVAEARGNHDSADAFELLPLIVSISIRAGLALTVLSVAALIVILSI